MIKVNGSTINEDDILREMQYHRAENQRASMIQASEALVISVLLRNRAETLGIAVDDNEHFVEVLLSQEVSYPKADEKDCLLYYQNNTARFTSSPLLAVRHILLACAPEDAETRCQSNDVARSLIEKLRQEPKSFEGLAKQYSRCPSASVGGQLGQISRGQTVPEFESQLFSCNLGLVEHSIESRYGVHVVVIDHREPGKLLPFALVKDKIRDYLNERVRHKAIAQYINLLGSEATIDGFQLENPFIH